MASTVNDQRFVAQQAKCVFDQKPRRVEHDEHFRDQRFGIRLPGFEGDGGGGLATQHFRAIEGKGLGTEKGGAGRIKDARRHVVAIGPNA